MHDQNIFFFFKVQFSSRSSDTSLDAIEVAHAVEGCKNQHSGDGNGNIKEMRGLRNTI